MIDKKRFATISLYLVFLIIASILFYSSRNMLDKSYDINTYETRKEDIYNAQLKLEQAIIDLNATMQKQLEYQEALTEKVAELSAKVDLPPPVINTTTVVQQPSTQQLLPTPITRAS